MLVPTLCLAFKGKAGPNKRSEKARPTAMEILAVRLVTANDNICGTCKNMNAITNNVVGIF